MGKVNTCGTIFSRRIDLATRAPKKVGSNAAEKKIHTWVMLTEGYLKKKNWFAPGMRMAQMRPTTQARKVDDGIEGSSVLATAERTSGYGDSSSSAQAVGSKLGSSKSSIAIPCRFPALQSVSGAPTFQPREEGINFFLLTKTPPRCSELYLSDSIDLFSSSASECAMDMAD